MYNGDFPTINTDLTMQVLLGMLGLGAMRSYEKKSGVASK
jgi:Tfp pilus assembly protein PilX